MANRLENETSPYLLQHKDNPVDWYPWCEEAFELAKSEDKPIFLSIGYSACHWCHVMERESFEDEETASIMNEHYVNIKVDREERPDVDSIYMQAVQALTGHGGWPMSVWLLPDGRPFYGGTYFPDTARQGMPSFKQVLNRIAEIYEAKRDSIENDASRLTSAISGRIMLDNEATRTLSYDILEPAFQKLTSTYDETWGGFGTQPKFPPSMTLELLMRIYHRRDDHKSALSMVTHTLDRMAWGGMYDQIGGGFHRYSVDRKWLVPHFEKMLYDNALLIRVYIYAYQLTGEERYRKIVEETISYVQREMTDAGGGFYSSQDADSEGKEGKYFVWTEQALREHLSDLDGLETLLDYWGVSKGPNFEGENILWVPESPEVVAHRHSEGVPALMNLVEHAKARLMEVRNRRVKPGRDDKILSSWNGLMITSLALAGRILDNDDYTKLASKAAVFVLGNLRQENGRLLRTYKDGHAKFNGYLQDYAFMIEALLSLYQATFELHWFEEAHELTEMMVSLYWDDESGFYDTAHDHESLITRPQDVTDNALPSGTSGAVAALARMAVYTGRSDWYDKVEKVISRLATAVLQYPQAFAYLASQLDFVLSEPYEVALVGDPEEKDMEALIGEIDSEFRPNLVMALSEPDDHLAGSVVPLLADRTMVNGHATAYVCRNFACKLPITDPKDLAEELSRESH